MPTGHPRTARRAPGAGNSPGSSLGLRFIFPSFSLRVLNSKEETVKNGTRRKGRRLRPPEGCPLPGWCAQGRRSSPRTFLFARRETLKRLWLSRELGNRLPEGRWRGQDRRLLSLGQGLLFFKKSPWQRMEANSRSAGTWPSPSGPSAAVGHRQHQPLGPEWVEASPEQQLSGAPAGSAPRPFRRCGSNIWGHVVVAQELGPGEPGEAPGGEEGASGLARTLSVSQEAPPCVFLSCLFLLVVSVCVCVCVLDAQHSEGDLPHWKPGSPRLPACGGGSEAALSKSLCCCLHWLRCCVVLEGAEEETDFLSRRSIRRVPGPQLPSCWLLPPLPGLFPDFDS